MGFAVIAFFGVVFLAMFGTSWPRATGHSSARATLHKLTVALEDYRSNFNTYPPDNFPSDNGSEMIWYYLGRGQTSGDEKSGLYIFNLHFVPSDRLSAWKFLSPLGGEYHYIRMNSGRSYLLVDPGRDKQLGGYLDREKGFVVTDPEKAEDNLTSTEVNE